MTDDELNVDDLLSDDVVLDDILNTDDVQSDESQNTDVKEQSETQIYEENTQASYQEDNSSQQDSAFVEETEFDEAPVTNIVEEVQNEYFSKQNTEEAQSNIFVEEMASSGNSGYLRWYSGNLSDNVYEFGKNSQSGNFTGTSDCNVIHVNVGYDTYGWIVYFDGGTVMNLRDVREYQIRNGALPAATGKIVFGQTELSFSNVEKIIVYERVRYFSYGV